jgi:hypothetical protein
MKMARIWRLDTGEDIFEIEKYYNQESRNIENLPIEIIGRVLEDQEILENINVAENDILLYEVKYADYLKANNSFAFMPQ